MASEKNFESFSRRISQLASRYAIWPTFFAAILLLLVFYHQSILTESDGGRLYIPIQTFLHPDQMPIWNPNLNGGMPIWGVAADVARINVIDSAFFSLLYSIRDFTPDVRFLYLFLNLLAFCGFMFALARKNNIAALPASFAAIIILFIPQYVINVKSGAWNHVLALALLPAVLLFVQLMFEHRRLLWFALASLAFAFQLLRASAIVSVVAVVFMIALYIVTIISKRWERTFVITIKRGALLLGVFAVGFLASAYVYAPFAEFLHYVRMNSALQQLSFSDLLLFLIPSFNGDIVRSAHHFALYASVITLFLAGFAVLLKRDALTFALVSLVFVFVVASLFGYTLASAYAAPFLIVLLSGFGLNVLVGYRQRKRSRQQSRWLDVYMIMVFSVFAAVAGLMLANKPAFMHHILKQIPLLTIPAQHAHYIVALRESALAFIFIGVAFLAVHLFLKDHITAMAFIMIVLFLTLIDLLLVDYKIDFTQHGQKEIPTDVLQQLERDSSHFRVFSTLDYLLTDYPSITGYGNVHLKAIHDFYLESGFNEPDMEGMHNPFFSKYTRIVSRFGDIVEEPVPVQYIDPARLNFDRAMLDMLNVKYILCNSPIYDPEYRVIADSELYIYENATVLPRAFFVDSVAVLPGRRAIFDAMKLPDFRPHRILYLDENPPFRIESADSNVVNVEHYSARKIVLRADVRQPAAMLLSEVYYPAGWNAFVDGAKVHIYRADHFLRAVFLAEGEHTIEFRYAPLAFIVGWWTSVATFLLLFLTLIAIGIAAVRTFLKEKGMFK